jgi:hypothetical protein
MLLLSPNFRFYITIIYYSGVVLITLYNILFPFYFIDSHILFHLSDNNPQGDVDMPDAAAPSSSSTQQVAPVESSKTAGTMNTKLYLAEKEKMMYQLMAEHESKLVERERLEYQSQNLVTPPKDSILHQIDEHRANDAKEMIKIEERIAKARLEENPQDIGKSDNKRTIDQTDED